MDISPGHEVDGTRPGPDEAAGDVEQYLRMMQRIGDLLLVALHDACEQLGIDYVVYGGTLLGAKREGGWIPWDDDVDVAMTRADLDVLRARAAEVLPPNVRYSDVFTDPMHVTKIPRLLYLDSERAARGSTRVAETPDGRHVGLDFFILDHAPRSDWAHRIWLRLIASSFQLAVARRWRRTAKAYKDTSVVRRAYRLAVLGVSHLLPERVWLRLHERVCNWFGRSGRSTAYSGTNHGKPAFSRLRIEPDELFPAVDAPFGDLMVRCPARTDSILRKMYGPSYMTPPAETDRAPLHQRTWIRARIDGVEHTCGTLPS